MDSFLEEIKKIMKSNIDSHIEKCEINKSEYSTLPCSWSIPAIDAKVINDLRQLKDFSYKGFVVNVFDDFYIKSDLGLEYRLTITMHHVPKEITQ